MYKRKTQLNILLSATGKVGNDIAETIWIHHPITGEKQMVFDKGKSFPFKGFKFTDKEKEQLKEVYYN